MDEQELHPTELTTIPEPVFLTVKSEHGWQNYPKKHAKPPGSRTVSEVQPKVLRKEVKIRAVTGGSPSDRANIFK